MALRPENLPRDPALLAELALALDAENESLRATIANLKGLIFGARSERMAAILAEQLALDLQDLADDVTPAAANDDAPSSPTTNSRGSRPKPKRNIGALPEASAALRGDRSNRRRRSVPAAPASCIGSARM